MKLSTTQSTAASTKVEQQTPTVISQYG